MVFNPQNEILVIREAWSVQGEQTGFGTGWKLPGACRTIPGMTQFLLEWLSPSAVTKPTSSSPGGGGSPLATLAVPVCCLGQVNGFAQLPANNPVCHSLTVLACVSPLPISGGLADLGEDFGQTATREIFEETGVESDFLGIVGFRHQHNTVFGRSDLYFVCEMALHSTDGAACTRPVAHTLTWVVRPMLCMVLNI